MDGFKKQPDRTADVPPPVQPAAPERSAEATTAPPAVARQPKKWLKWVIPAAVVTVMIGGALGWYVWALGPVKARPADCPDHKLGADGGREDCALATGDTIEIQPGESVDDIASNLQDVGVIKSQLAFKIYLKMSGKAGGITAGKHTVFGSMSVPEIVSTLTEIPKQETFRVTFLPGGTLADAKKTLQKAGYPEADIDTAFTKQYQHPVLADKPAGADLEGYIYGETYEFYQGAPLENIVKTCLDELYKAVQAGDLVAKFKAQGLNLYQGIILASIVQREGGDDLPGVASVFLNRLGVDMTLGSDVTYQYIADKLGIKRDPYLDNPYNTRRYPGLPPGPISSPGKNALLAVADPSQTDYLFFLSGDDDKTYFAKTEAEHNRNIQQHCQEKCLIL
jgi:UPF0755 protein